MALVRNLKKASILDMAARVGLSDADMLLLLLSCFGAAVAVAVAIDGRLVDAADSIATLGTLKELKIV